MEIIDPRTKSCTFLTLKDYVGEKGKFKRAQCLLEKNEAFMSSENLWIAAESFKISVSPNPKGLIYRMIPPEYFMEAQYPDPNPTQIWKTPIATKFVDVDLSGVADTYPMAVKFNWTAATTANPVTNPQALDRRSLDMDAILRYWLRELNRFYFCKDAHVISGLAAPGQPPQQMGNLNLQIGTDPLDALRGNAFGDQGLERIEASFVNNHPQPVGGAVASNYSQYWKIDGKKHPGLTVVALKQFLCGGRYGSFAYRLDRNPAQGQIDSNPGRLPQFQIYGPANITATSDFMTSEPGPNYDAEVPNVAIFSTAGGLKKGSNANAYHANGRLYHSPITELSDDWIFKDSHGDFYMSLWSHQINGNQQGSWTNPPPKDAVYQFYAGGDLTATAVEDNFTLSVTTKVGQFTDMAGNNGNLPVQCTVSHCPLLGAQQVNVPENQRIFYTRRVSTWATDENEVPCYTPNDFFARFNTFPGNTKPPYRLGQDPNGGFRVSILQDGLLGFAMSKVMIDDLGLQNFLTVPTLLNWGPKTDMYQPEVIPLDDNNNWIASYSGPGNFSARLTLGVITDFSVIDQVGNITGPLTVDTVLETLLISHLDGKRYQLVQMHQLKYTDANVEDSKIPGALMSDSDNNLFYFWAKPPQGSFLSNLQTVSLDSFAKFSSIRIVIPDGVIFQPMLAGRSDARILAELRLVFDLSPSQVLRGFGPDEETYGLLMSTSFTNYGDLLWNASPSKQYLQVTSGNPIYRINCEVRLIPRDPTEEPVVLYLGYNDLFELKLRLLQLQ